MNKELFYQHLGHGYCLLVFGRVCLGVLVKICQHSLVVLTTFLESGFKDRKSRQIPANGPVLDIVNSSALTYSKRPLVNLGGNAKASGNACGEAPKL